MHRASAMQCPPTPPRWMMSFWNNLDESCGPKAHFIYIPRGCNLANIVKAPGWRFQNVAFLGQGTHLKGICAYLQASISRAPPGPQLLVWESSQEAFQSSSHFLDVRPGQWEYFVCLLVASSFCDLGVGPFSWFWNPGLNFYRFVLQSVCGFLDHDQKIFVGPWI